MSYPRPNGRMRPGRPMHAYSPGVNASDRVQLLLSTLLRSEGDPTYSNRIAAGQQLATLINSSDISCEELIRIRGVEIETALQDIRAPAQYKQMVAMCLAAFAVPRGDAIVLLQWVFRKVLTSDPNVPKETVKEFKNWLLVTVREFLELCCRRLPSPIFSTPDDCIVLILNELQTFLDVMESSDYLPKVLDLFHYIGDKYPGHFTVAFKDVIDLLVGWCIDPSLPKTIAALISDTFKKLWPFWLKHIDFGLELLKHLLSDIESLAQVKCEPGRTVEPDESFSIRKPDRSGRVPNTTAIIFRCLQSVLYVVSFASFRTMNPDCQAPLQPTSRAYGEYLHAVEWCLNLLRAIGGKHDDRLWLAQGIGIIRFLSKALERSFKPFQRVAVEIMMLECELLVEEYSHGKLNDTSLEKDAQQWLENVETLLDLWVPHISEDVVTQFIRPSASPLLRDFRRLCSRAPQVLTKLHGLIEVVFTSTAENISGSARNVKNEENLYLEELVLEMYDLFEKIFAKGDESSQERLAFNDPRLSLFNYAKAMVVKGRTRQAAYCNWVNELLGMEPEILHIILMSDIQLVATATQLALIGFPHVETCLVLISMLQHLLVNGSSVIEDRNGGHLRTYGTLLLTVYSVARSQYFYVHQCHGTVNRSSVQMAVTSQLRIIHSALQIETIEHDEKLVTLMWFQEMLDALSEEAGMMMACEVPEECPALIETCIGGFIAVLEREQDAQLREEIAKILQSYFQWTTTRSYNEGQVPAAVESLIGASLRRLQDVDSTVVGAYFNVLKTVHPVGFLNAANAQQSLSDSHTNAKLAFMSAPASGAFRAKHFQAVVSYLGMDIYLQQADDGVAVGSYNFKDPSWTERLFHACQSISFLEATTASRIDENVNIDACRSHLMFWALWEAARYCILSRLRTPFGSALQTFEVFESTLRDSIAALQMVSTYERGPGATKNLFRDVQKLRHLMMFLYLLELQIYNAAEGSLNCAVVPKASVAFFYTNKRSCEEWFARIRKHLVIGSRLTGSSSFTARHAMQYLGQQSSNLPRLGLKDKVAWFSDVDDVLLDLGDELSVLNDNDTLVGIASWQNKMRASMESNTGDNERQIMLLKKHESYNAASSGLEILPWFEASGLLAEGKYEGALSALRTTFDRLRQDKKLTASNKLISAVEKNITDCYLNLRDCDGLAEWLALLKSTPAEKLAPEEVKSPYLTGHHEAVLSSWAHLARTRSIDILVDVDDQIALCDALHLRFPTSCIRASETHLFKLLAALGSSGEFAEHTRQQMDRTSTYAGNLLRETLTICADDNMRQFAGLLTQSYLINLVAKFVTSRAQGAIAVPFSQLLEKPYLKSPTSRDLRSLNIIDDVMNAISSSKCGVADDCRMRARNAMKSIQFSMATLARKTENYKLARRLWNSELGTAMLLESGKRYEYAKLKNARGSVNAAVNMLLSSLNGVSESSSTQSSENSAALRSKILVRLSEWTRGNNWASLDSSTQKNVADICGLDDPELIIENTSAQEISEDLVLSVSEHLLRKATALAPDNDKAWLKYGDYMHHQARKAAEEATGARNRRTVHQPELRAIILELEGQNESTDDVIEMITGAMCRELGENVESSSVRAPLDQMSVAIQNAHPKLHFKTVEKIVSLALAFKSRVIESFKVAVMAYFTFLRVPSSSAHMDVSDARTTSTTLRVLRLFLKYWAQLEDVFIPGFRTTPVQLWQTIIPQLYARVDHPEPIVRETIADLLCRIGEAAPHLIVYHAAVESVAGSPPPNGTSSDKVLHVLRHKGSGSLVTHVQRMVEELKRMTVLWEEQWLHALAHMQGDAMKQVERIEEEIARVNASLLLSKEKKLEVIREYYGAIMRPLVTALEQLVQSTSCTSSSTPHELWFQRTYGTRIRDALDGLRKPKNPSEPKSAWDVFHKIYADLGKELQKSRLLKLSDVSPFLARSRDSIIPMPGLPQREHIITVQSFDSNLQVLPTKTKPKKLQLMGSNGTAYTYLFKGLEDLHLDERIQQFLHIINALLVGEKSAASRRLRARTYAVIPFGQRYGMIQWVQDVTPLFTLYKRWQQREYTARLLQRKEGEDSETVAPPLRPHEMFYAKISAALHRYGLSHKSPRREWPLAAVREAFSELQKETPPNLLSRELFCSSPTPSIWLEKVKVYGRSVAVMSVIGYIIGLGDRHLDNILFDPSTGEIVHIDYNVCFENGRRLRVPETVPFRLTQNMYTALGVAGADGGFRIASENVMRVLRDNRETLLTLLEAFVYDPLVDWTKDATENLNKQMAELNVNIGVLKSRIVEKLPAVENYFSNFKSLCEDLRQKLEVANLNRAEALSVSSADRTQQISLLQNALAERYAECQMWQSQHSKAVVTLKGPLLQACAGDVLNTDLATTFPPFAPVIFALGATESQMMRCVEVDQQLVRVAKERMACYNITLEHLQGYQALAAPVAERLVEQDHFSLWEILLKPLLDSNGDESKYLAVHRSEFEASPTEHTRKAAIEVIMKATCAAKEKELKCAQNALLKATQATLRAKDNENVTDFLRTVHASLSTSTVSTLIHCGILEQLADFGQMLFLLIKDPAKASLLLGHKTTSIRLYAEESACIFGNYAFGPDHIHVVCAIGSFIALNAEVLKGATAALSMETSGSCSIDAFRQFALLSGCVRAMQWHMTDVLVPEVILIMTKEDISISVLIDELAVMSADIDENLEQTSDAFQSEARRMAHAFTALCTRYAARPPCAAQAVLSSFNTFFSPIVAAMQDIPGQKSGSETQIIHNALIVKQILSILETLRACVNYYAHSEMNLDDPSHEWITNFDFSDIMRENDDFSKAVQSFKSYLDICTREICMKPMTKLLGKIIKRIGGLLPNAEGDGKPIQLSGIPFVDNARSMVEIQMKLNNDLTRHFPTLRTVLTGQVNVMAQTGISQEGSIHMRRFEARLQQRKLALLRYQLLHEAALTYPTRHGPQSGLPLITPRTEFIENIRQDMPHLIQLSSDLLALEGLCQTLETELAPLLAWAASDPTKTSALGTFADTGLARAAIIVREIQRVKSLIELCDTLIHFESFRVLNVNTQTMDKAILDLVKELHTIVKEPTQEEKGKLEMNARRESLRSMLVMIRAISATHETGSALVEDIHDIMRLICQIAAPIQSGDRLKEDLETYLSRWARFGDHISEFTNSASELDHDDPKEVKSTWVQSLRVLTEEAPVLSKELLSFATLKQVEMDVQENRALDQQGPTEEIQAHAFARTPVTQFGDLQGPIPEFQTTTPDAPTTQAGDMDLPSSNPRAEIVNIHEVTPGDSTSLPQEDMAPLHLDVPENLAQVQGNQVRTNQAQERNAYALNVLRRVRAKLDGREYSEQHRMSVPEQVNTILEEATKIDHLCAMYEGWMGWI